MERRSALLILRISAGLDAQNGLKDVVLHSDDGVVKRSRSIVVSNVDI